MKRRENKMATNGRVAFLDLRSHHCRFPFGHTGEPDFGFCGEPKANGWAWCELHAKVVYRDLEKERRERRNDQS
jgi:GcrA cell cycle regulator